MVKKFIKDNSQEEEKKPKSSTDYYALNRKAMINYVTEWKKGHRQDVSMAANIAQHYKKNLYKIFFYKDYINKETNNLRNENTNTLRYDTIYQSIKDKPLDVAKSFIDTFKQELLKEINKHKKSKLKLVAKNIITTARTKTKKLIEKGKGVKPKLRPNGRKYDHDTEYQQKKRKLHIRGGFLRYKLSNNVEHQEAKNQSLTSWLDLLRCRKQEPRQNYTGRE